jgi:hypothetical protein
MWPALDNPMTRRESLLMLGVMLADAAKALPQSAFSTRGDYLNWSPEEKRYWFLSARDGLARLRRIAYAHSRACDLREIATSGTGLPVYAIRLGNGAKRVAIMAGMHGCEPSGPRGLLAYLDTLLSHVTPFGVSVDSSKILSAVTLYLIPLLNPGGAQQFSMHFPDSWQGTWIPQWTQANATRFFAEANEPEYFFYHTYVKKPPMRFTPDQIAQWESSEHVLGSSLTDGGLDMWFDWDDTHGVETRGAKDLLEAFRPHTVMDIHNFMFPTQVFAPTVYSHGPMAQQERTLALNIQRAWGSHQLLFNNRPPRPYPKAAKRYYEDSWFHYQLGARTLIVEVNGGMLATRGAEYVPLPGQHPLTRRESLESAFLAAHVLVDYIVAEA